MSKIINTKTKEELAIIENEDVRNISLSNELRKKYNHKENKSYENMYELFNEGIIDEYIVGYVIIGNRNIIRRQAWGIKDCKIIDTSLKSKELKNKVKYFESFSISRDNEDEIKWSDIAEVGYEDKMECESLKRIDRYLRSLMIMDDRDFLEE